MGLLIWVTGSEMSVECGVESWIYMINFVTHIRRYFKSDSWEKCAECLKTHALFIVIVIFFCGILEILVKCWESCLSLKGLSLKSFVWARFFGCCCFCRIFRFWSTLKPNWTFYCLSLCVCAYGYVCIRVYICIVVVLLSLMHIDFFKRMFIHICFVCVCVFDFFAVPTLYLFPYCAFFAVRYAYTCFWGHNRSDSVPAQAKNLN